MIESYNITTPTGGGRSNCNYGNYFHYDTAAPPTIITDLYPENNNRKIHKMELNGVKSNSSAAAAAAAQFTTKLHLNLAANLVSTTPKNGMTNGTHEGQNGVKNQTKILKSSSLDFAAALLKLSTVPKLIKARRRNTIDNLFYEESSDSNLDSDDDSEDEEESHQHRKMALKRCSSLKSGKTPPSTPGRKKIVHFADVLGLDLIKVRTFLDEIPNVPKSAFRDLDLAAEERRSQIGVNNNPQQQQQRQQQQQQQVSQLVPTFHQPVSQPNFFDVIRNNKVSLENAYTTTNKINGTVRVLNMGFAKSVIIRYTLDEWKSFKDFEATYTPNSCDGFSDKFEFEINHNTTPSPTSPVSAETKFQFAILFNCSGQEFWDSNNGLNYTFDYVANLGNNGNNGHQTNGYNSGSTALLLDSWKSSSSSDIGDHIWM